MSLLHPVLLLLLVPVAALVGGYLHLQNRRRHYAVRFTNIDLLDSVAPRRPGWRRHVPAAAIAVSLIAATIGLARPVHAVDVPSDSAVVMLAVDVSASMAAVDVDPDRLTSAKAAAASFLEELPDGFQVGLVSFDKSARIVVTPTTDHDAVIAAVEALQLGTGTAAGDGIVASLQAIEAAQLAAGVQTSDFVPTAVDDGTAPSTAIVLLSDGKTTSGVEVEVAAQQAAAEGVPVSTITFGTGEGVVQIEGEVVPVPPDSAAMQTIADITGGTAFDASSTSELNAVYEQIQAQVGYHSEQQEMTVWFLAAALVLTMLAFAGSMLWNGRFL
jgi:Ca-activated chloride channel family protein